MPPRKSKKKRKLETLHYIKNFLSTKTYVGRSSLDAKKEVQKM